jgi:hypothetical protein
MDAWKGVLKMHLVYSKLTVGEDRVPILRRFWGVQISESKHKSDFQQQLWSHSWLQNRFSESTFRTDLPFRLNFKFQPLHLPGSCISTPDHSRFWITEKYSVLIIRWKANSQLPSESTTPWPPLVYWTSIEHSVTSIGYEHYKLQQQNMPCTVIIELRRRVGAVLWNGSADVQYRRFQKYDFFSTSQYDLLMVTTNSTLSAAPVSDNNSALCCYLVTRAMLIR